MQLAVGNFARSYLYITCATANVTSPTMGDRKWMKAWRWQQTAVQATAVCFDRCAQKYLATPRNATPCHATKQLVSFVCFLCFFFFFLLARCRVVGSFQSIFSSYSYRHKTSSLLLIYYYFVVVIVVFFYCMNDYVSICDAGNAVVLWTNNNTDWLR